MSHGRSIRIFLADGSASGIRHAEVVNWTGQAIVCPRGRISELSEWSESQKPGVYILVGDDPDATRPLAYIGEAENVLDRLRTHVRDETKEYWDQVVFFTSKDENITKAHVKYLEARLCEIAREVGRVTLKNGTDPRRPRLPKADVAAMEEFIGPARLLLASLGFSVLQPITRKNESNGTALSGPSGPLADIPLVFAIPKREVEAKGSSTDEGFVVLAGSFGEGRVRTSLSKGWRMLRDDLLADGSIVMDGDRIAFARDVLFKSPSAAASVIAGHACNGRVSWRDATGRTLGELEEELLSRRMSD